MLKRTNVAKTLYDTPYAEGCQIKCVPEFAENPQLFREKRPVNIIKRFFAQPWNRYIKPWLKKGYYSSAFAQQDKMRKMMIESFAHSEPLRQGERVMVRSREEIMSTLDPFNELKGCSFLNEMQKYCRTEQTVLKSMKYFMDERDYKRKKTRGLVLLENIICSGTPVFGSCDRCCFLFWREEWLEKI